MPTISINKTQLFDKLKIKTSDHEFSDFLFDFGLELDDILVEENEVIYKIEIPANRYDLLCLEGLFEALAIYKGDKKFEELVEYKENKIAEKVVFYHNKNPRQFIACAIINEIDLNEPIYSHFIDYQDKLHSSLGRNRSLTAIGTHDCDKIEFPVHYKSLDPAEINFVPLNFSQKKSASQICENYALDSKMKNYVNILRSYDKYPVFEDANGRILSLPPLINSEFSKISPSTKNVFVEVTGTDFNKTNQALNCILHNFKGKGYSKIRIIECNIDDETKNTIKKFHENLKISNPPYKKGEKIDFCYTTPILKPRTYEFNLQKINKKLGIELENNEILISLLNRMMHSAIIKDDTIIITVSPSRSDILHECDLIEDIAISYGYNNFIRKPVDMYSIAYENPLNKFCNKLRNEAAECGYNELLTQSLLSAKDSISASISSNSVILQNPQSSECEVVRNSLLPGILKNVSANQHSRIPMKVFEISDVVCVEEKIQNKRMMCAVYIDKTDGFEYIIGFLSMILMKIGFRSRFKYLETANLNTYFELRGGLIYIDDDIVGNLGVLHPKVCEMFGIPFAMSAFEIDIDVVFDKFLK